MDWDKKITWQTIQHEKLIVRSGMRNSSSAQVYYIAEEYTRCFVLRFVVKSPGSFIDLPISAMAVLLNCPSNCDVNQEGMGKITRRQNKIHALNIWDVVYDNIAYA